MATDINLTINIPAPPPPAPAPQPQSSDSQTQDVNQGGTQQASGQPQQQPTNNTTDNSATGTGGGHFSNLLNNHTQAGNTNGGQKAPPSHTGNTNDKSTQASSGNGASSASSGSGASSGAGASAMAALLLTQIQNLSGSSSASGVSSASGTSSASGSSSGSTLAELQKLLQELMQLSQQENASTSSGSGASASSGNGTAGQTQGKGKSASDNTDSLTQLVTQIAALLQQMNTQQTSSTPSAGSAQDATISSGSGGSGGASAQQAALLAQLTRELADKLGQQVVQPDATGKTADSEANTGATSGASNVSASFEAQLNALTQSADGKDALQSALSSAGALLSVTPENKQGDADANTGNGNNAANTNLAGQIIPASTQNAQQTQDSGFAKLVSAPQQTQSPADQVLVQIKNAISDGTNTIKVQLSPADLGKVTVQLTTTPDGKTGITITADNRQTLSMLQSEAKTLSSNLRDIGMKTDTGGLSFNLSGQQQQQQQTPGKQGGYTQVAGIDADDEAEYNNTVSQIYSLRAQEGLDIRV